MKGNYLEFLKRSLALALSFVMFAAFFPLIGNEAAFAADDSTGYEEGTVGTGAISSGDLQKGKDYSGMCIYDGKVMTEEDIQAALDAEEGVTEEGGDGFDLSELTTMAEDESDADELIQTDAVASRGTAAMHLEGFALNGGLGAAENEAGAEANYLSDYNMTVDYDEDGNAYINAYVGDSGVSFDSLYVDDILVTYFYGEQTISNYYLDMTDYPVGPHNVILYLDGSSSSLVTTHVPTNIYGIPDIKLSNFYTCYNNFQFSNDYSNTYDFDSDCQVYLDYKKGSGEWNTGYGPVSSGDTVKKSGLSPAKKYKVRAYYGKQGTYDFPTESGYYDTEEYFYKGDYSDTKTMKTAYKKTPIKSIKIKCRKQYSKKYRYKHIISTWWVGNVMWYKYRWKTARYWITKIKVTVKMKKKPGVAGIYIGSKKAKGNKKTYSKKFTLSGKKKGKKIKVSVQSYMSKTYGGWSKVTKKKVRVR